jgi:hypothetical protein
MDFFTSLVVLAVSLGILYFIVHGAVFSALRRHSLWERDGSMEKELAERRYQKGRGTP